MGNDALPQVIDRARVEPEITRSANEGAVPFEMGQEGTMLVAAGAHGLVRVAQGSHSRVELGPGRAALDVAPGPSGDWWLLSARASASPRVLARLDAELAPRWERECGGARMATPHPATDRVWVLDFERGRAEAFGALGEPLVPSVALASAPLVAAAVDPGGGLLAATAGAILRLTPRGAPRPGQGRLERTTDLAWRF